jgi:D-proline reductase (dithiol) PrdB
VGLVQRVIEEAGIPTISLTLLPFITRKVKVPRAMAVDFPFAHPLGKPFDVEQQMSIINDAFRELTSITEPGTIVELPYKWPEEDTDKQDWWPEEPPPIHKFMQEQEAKKKKKG